MISDCAIMRKKAYLAVRASLPAYVNEKATRRSSFFVEAKTGKGQKEEKMKTSENGIEWECVQWLWKTEIQMKNSLCLHRESI